MAKIYDEFGYYVSGEDEPAHVGPAVEDYGSIGKKLAKLEVERSQRVQAHPLPEPGAVPDRKPWWTA